MPSDEAPTGSADPIPKDEIDYSMENNTDKAEDHADAEGTVVKTTKERETVSVK